MLHRHEARSWPVHEVTAGLSVCSDLWAPGTSRLHGTSWLPDAGAALTRSQLGVGRHRGCMAAAEPIMGAPAAVYIRWRIRCWNVCIT